MIAPPRVVRGLVAVTGALVVAVGALLLQAPAAHAVQTATFGLAATPDAHGQARSSLTFPADGATVRDRVLVYNRTDKAITVNLDVVSADHRGASYLVGQSSDPVSKRVSLKVDHITLQAHQQANVPVTIKTPRGGTSDQLAAITATSGNTSDGTVAVAQRLALFVDLTATDHLVPSHRSLIDGIAIGLGLLLLILLLLLLLWRRRRRTEEDEQQARRRVSPPRPTAPRNATARTGPGASAKNGSTRSTKPVSAKPTVAKPTVAKPAVGKPAVGKPAATRPAVAKPTVAKPTATRPAVATPTAVKPTAVKPTATRPAATKPAAAKPIAAKPVSARTTPVRRAKAVRQGASAERKRS